MVLLRTFHWKFFGEPKTVLLWHSLQKPLFVTFIFKRLKSHTPNATVMSTKVISLCSGVSALCALYKSLQTGFGTWNWSWNGLERGQMREEHCVPLRGVSTSQAVEQAPCEVSFRERSASSERQTESKACASERDFLHYKDSRCVLIQSITLCTKKSRICALWWDWNHILRTKEEEMS